MGPTKRNFHGPGYPTIGNFTDLCQLLFKYLVLFEPVNVALWYVIDCSLADQTYVNFTRVDSQGGIVQVKQLLRA